MINRTKFPLGISHVSARTGFWLGFTISAHVTSTLLLFQQILNMTLFLGSKKLKLNRKESVLLPHITWTHQLAENIYIWVSIESCIRFQTYNYICYSCIYKVTPFNRQKNAPSKQSSWIAVIMPKQVQWSVMRHCPKANEETCQEIL